MNPIVSRLGDGLLLLAPLLACLGVKMDRKPSQAGMRPSMKAQPVTLLFLIFLFPASAQTPQATSSRPELSEVGRCRGNLFAIDNAILLWAMAKHKPADSPVTLADISPFMVPGNVPICPRGGTYGLTVAGNRPTCSLHGLALPPDTKAPPSLSRPIPVVVEKSPAEICRDQIRMLNFGLAMYFDDNGKLPADLKALGPYCGHDISILSCGATQPEATPAARRNLQAMKAAWEALPIEKISYRYAIQAETPPQAVIRCPRHQYEANYPPSKK